jgi:hypothetical protein
LYPASWRQIALVTACWVYPLDAGELLDVDMEEIAWSFPLVAREHGLRLQHADTVKLQPAEEQDYGDGGLWYSQMQEQSTASPQSAIDRAGFGKWSWSALRSCEAGKA